jgi:hypothetical protein
MTPFKLCRLSTVDFQSCVDSRRRTTSQILPLVALAVQKSEIVCSVTVWHQSNKCVRNFPAFFCFRSKTETAIQTRRRPKNEQHKEVPMFLSDVLNDADHQMGYGQFNNVFNSKNLPGDDHPLLRIINPSLFTKNILYGVNFTRSDVFSDEYDCSLPEFSLNDPLSQNWSKMKRNTSVSCWSLRGRPSRGLIEAISKNGGAARTIAITTTIEKLVRGLSWPDAPSLRMRLLGRDPEDRRHCATSGVGATGSVAAPSLRGRSGRR